MTAAMQQGSVADDSSLRLPRTQTRADLQGLVEPKDLIATIFPCLGHAPETTIHDLQSRPLSLTRGKVIYAIV